ncbi:MAG: hypothetical protein KF685_13750 [Acidobacteria bacterium]|nr:hypothetical protein [Acidobacteriota bacterium]
MKNMRLMTTIFIFAVLASCSTKDADKPEFLEFRLHRSVALKGGEILVIRRVGKEWEAMLMGDERRFSCQYQKEVTPRSDWGQVWDTIIAKGLRDISNASDARSVEDGDVFFGEFTEKEKFSRFSIANPDLSESESAKKLLDISNYLSKEFGTPVFSTEMNNPDIGAYLINECKEIKK